MQERVLTSYPPVVGLQMYTPPRVCKGCWAGMQAIPMTKGPSWYMVAIASHRDDHDMRR